jgi:hypothetical protein
MEFSLSRVFSECLNYSDGQAILSAIELENIFSLYSTLLLFPLEDFLNSGVPDNSHAFIVIEEPLNHIGHRIYVNPSSRISLERRQVHTRFIAIGWIGGRHSC